MYKVPHTPSHGPTSDAHLYVAYIRHWGKMPAKRPVGLITAVNFKAIASNDKTDGYVRPVISARHQAVLKGATHCGLKEALIAIIAVSCVVLGNR